MTDLVLTHIHDNYAEIVFNRVEKRNAINWAMMQGIADALDEIERLPHLRAVLLRGEGPHMSTGIDLTDLMGTSERFGEGWRENLFPLTAAYQEVANKLERCSIPTIALIHGYCLGLACELVLACDFRIAAQGATIGLPETRVGLVPDVGGTARLTRLLGIGRAKEYILTGKSFDLQDAERWGLVNYVVAPEDLPLKAEQFIAELAAAAPLAVRHAKKIINDMTSVHTGLQLEALSQAQLIMTEDFLHGAQTMLSKQPPNWKAK